MEGADNSIFISYEEAAQLISEGKTLVSVMGGTRLSHLRGTTGEGVEVYMQDLTLPGPASAFLIDVNKDERGYVVRLSRDGSFDDYITSMDNPEGFYIANVVSDGENNFYITQDNSPAKAIGNKVEQVVNKAKKASPMAWIVGGIVVVAIIYVGVKVFKKAAA